MALTGISFLRLFVTFTCIQLITSKSAGEMEVKIFYGTNNKLLTSLQQDHLDDYLVVKLPHKSEILTLDVYLNTNYNLDKLTEEDEYSICDHIKPVKYNGKVRGNDDSKVKLIICGKIMGFVRSNDEIIHFTSASFTNNNINEQVPGKDTTDRFLVDDLKKPRSHRKKRETTSKFNKPYEANANSLYIELALVIDNELFSVLNESEIEVYKRYQNITNHVSALFQEFNIFVVLVEIEILKKDEISLVENSVESALVNFAAYVEKTMKAKSPDVMILIMYNGASEKDQKTETFSDSEICNFSMIAHDVVLDSGTSEYELNVTKSIANVLGHNLGIRKNDDDSKCECKSSPGKCKCPPNNQCIMTKKPLTSSGSKNLAWSPCNKEILSHKADPANRKKLPCITELPTKLLDISSCGNGFVENDEECDCGWQITCKNYTCCDPQTCKIRKDECRPARDECDLAETCDGRSPKCPEDVVKSGTERCSETTNCTPNKTCNAEVIKCEENCYGNGYCDNKGHCHCFGTFDSVWCRNNEQPHQPNNTDDKSQPGQTGHLNFSTTLNVLVIILALLLSFSAYYTIKKLCCKKRHQSDFDVKAFYSRDNPSFGTSASTTPPRHLNTRRLDIADFSQNSQHCKYPFEKCDEQQSLDTRQKRDNDSVLNYATLTWDDSFVDHIPEVNRTVYATVNRKHEVDVTSQPTFADIVFLGNETPILTRSKMIKNENSLNS